MLGATRRRRSLRGQVLILFMGVALLCEAVPARADHDKAATGDDPAAYGEPHAGWVAPPRGPGRLAPATGALFGTHSEDSHSGELNAEDQHILETEEALGFRMHINNSYYGAFDAIADDWDPDDPDKRGLSKLAFSDVGMGRIPLVGWGCGPGDENTTATTTRPSARRLRPWPPSGTSSSCSTAGRWTGDKRTKPGAAAEFVAAWIRIHDIFRAEGADNVVWVWCANANSFKHAARERGGSTAAQPDPPTGSC